MGIKLKLALDVPRLLVDVANLLPQSERDIFRASGSWKVGNPDALVGHKKSFRAVFDDCTMNGGQGRVNASLLTA